MTTYYLLDVGYSNDEEGYEDGLKIGQELRINFEGLKLRTKIETIEFDVDTDEEGNNKSDRFVVLRHMKEESED